MPCYDERNEPEYILRQERAQFRHNSDVAQLLCAVLTQLNQHTAVTHPTLLEKVASTIPGLKTWWVEHQQRDSARL